MLQAEHKHIDLDDRKNPLMTARTLKYYMEKEGLFATPELNQKMYLQFKGFLKIVPETISQYHNLTVLWLNNNGISKIQGLHTLINLTSLSLNNNSISKMQALENLQNLTILNLSYNKIEMVEGISNLRKLQTINLAHNFLYNSTSIEELSTASGLTTIDLSENQLENTEEMFHSIVNNKQLLCLYLKSTPFSRTFRNYRKRLTGNLKRLKFLDDRPVLQQDHRLAQAWLQGGVQGEKEIKEKLALQVRNKQQMRISRVQKTKNVEMRVEQGQKMVKEDNEQQQQEKLYARYVQQQRLQLQKKRKANDLQKEKKQNKQRQLYELSNYYQNSETEVITAQVQKILGKDFSLLDSEQNAHFQQKMQQKWKPKYEKMLQTLLLRYKFDFSQVQPSFNMILADINKKLMRGVVRFEIDQLRKIWTQIEKRKRNEV